MSNKRATSSGSSGIGFTGLLTIVFIVLKLTGYIDWDWIWVLAPIWIGAILTIVVLVIAVIVFVLVELKK